jgi:hypothetical protein
VFKDITKMKNYKDQLNTVPFGNSVFQIKQFIANQETPERSRRHVLLQLDQKQKAMNECKFRRQRREVDILEIDEKLKTATTFEKMRLLIDKEEAEYYLDAEIKLIEDCVIEIKAYEKILETLPEFTREEFETGELNYWRTRLIKSAERELMSKGSIGEGNIQALEQVGILGIQISQEGKLLITEDKNFKLIETKLLEENLK